MLDGVLPLKMSYLDLVPIRMRGMSWSPFDCLPREAGCSVVRGTAAGGVFSSDMTSRCLGSGGAVWERFLPGFHHAKEVPERTIAGGGGDGGFSEWEASPKK